MSGAAELSSWLAIHATHVCHMVAFRMECGVNATDPR
jgi:hypothetical protein